MTHGQADHRRRLLEGLRGAVLELGAGDGTNFRFYPPEVTEILAIEPENRLRRQAQEAARDAAALVRVVPGWDDDLPAGDESVDAAVASLVLCSVPDQERALGELFRVVRPGGQLRFYEHVRARSPGHARLQRAIEPIWHRIGGGCHPSRDTVSSIGSSSFELEQCDRFTFAPGLLSRVAAPHVLGTARRP